MRIVASRIVENLESIFGQFPDQVRDKIIFEISKELPEPFRGERSKSIPLETLEEIKQLEPGDYITTIYDGPQFSESSFSTITFGRVKEKPIENSSVICSHTLSLDANSEIDKYRNSKGELFIIISKAFGIKVFRSSKSEILDFQSRVIKKYFL